MSKQSRAYIHDLIKKGARMDGRAFDEYRQPITVEYNVSKSAEGSAKVTMGDTIVMAGVKTEVGTPYPDTPDQGGLMVGAEFLPMASPKFEPGPPSAAAIELGRVIDRGIRESKAIDVKKLCIKEGELVWTVIIDIMIINDAGNLFDAASLAAMAAIKTTKMPALKDNQIDYKTLTDEGLPIDKMPLSVTVHKIGGQLFVDPITEEEEVSDARLTVAVIGDELCALQKGGEEALTTDEIGQMVDLAIEKVKELMKYLEA